MELTETKNLKELSLEQVNETKRTKILKRFVTILPIGAGFLHLWEYNFIPNYRLNTSTNTYNIFIGFFLGILIIWFIFSFFKKNIYEKLAYKSPFYAVLFLLLTAYDVATLKTGKLALPYFPWLDQILNAMISDRKKLLDCTGNSLQLLFNGYFKGIAAGIICGVGAGWSRKIYYWIYPVTKILGAVPTTTYMPIVMMLAASLESGSAFIIALGVWFPVTMTTMTGVANVRKHYFEVARTLGTKQIGILFRVAVPAALPGIFNGLTQGMSVACLTLVVAEMMGVKSGLGWYVNWQKGWANFSKMYGAIALICITFIATNGILNLIKRRVLRWQKGAV